MDKRKLTMMTIFLAAFLLNTGMTAATDSVAGGLPAQSNKMQTCDDVKSQSNTFSTSEYAKLFPENKIHGNPEYTRSLTHADFNGDGKLDIIVTKHGVNYLYKGDGKGGFTAYKMHDKSKNTNSVSVADVNGDGIQDIITGNGDDANYCYENEGTGNFKPHKVHSNEKKTNLIITADIDNDGEQDILVANIGDKNYWYENDGNRQFTAHEIHSNAKDTFFNNNG